MASLVVPLGFLLARRVFTSAALAVAAVALVVSMPEFMMTADHGGNEPLAIVLGTASVLSLCSLAGDTQRPLRHALLPGFLLGCTAC